MKHVPVFIEGQNFYEEHMLAVIKGLEEDTERTKMELEFITKQKEEQIRQILDVFEGVGHVERAIK